MAEDIMPTIRQKIQLNNDELMFFQKDVTAWQENLKSSSWDEPRSLEDLALGDSSEDEEDELIKQGNKCLENGEWSRAVSFYSSAISRNGEGRCYLKRSLAYLRRNNLLESENDCSEAIRLNPKCARAYIRRACVRKRLGKSKECCDDLEMLLQLEPDNQIVSSEYSAMIMFATEEIASKKYESGAKEREEMASKLKIEGNKLISEQNYRQAKEKFTSAIKLCPGDAKLFANRAICHMKLKDFNSAEEDCSKALELDWKYVKVYVRRSRVRRNLRKFNEARQDLYNAFELSGGDGNILDELEETDGIVKRTEEELRKKNNIVEEAKLWPIEAIRSGNRDETRCVILDWSKLKPPKVNATRDCKFGSNKKIEKEPDLGNSRIQGIGIKYDRKTSTPIVAESLSRFNLKEVKAPKISLGFSRGPFIKVRVDDAKFAVPKELFETPEKFARLLSAK